MNKYVLKMDVCGIEKVCDKVKVDKHNTRTYSKLTF